MWIYLLASTEWLNRRFKVSLQHCYIDEQTQIFFANLDQILLNQLRILSDPNLYYFYLESWYVGAAPVAQHKVYLGDLMILWQSSPTWLNQQAEVILLLDGWSRGRKGIWENKKGLYLISLSGSALSGANSALAWDLVGKKFIKFTSPTVFGALKSLNEKVPLRPPKKDLSIPKSVGDLLIYLGI